MTRQVLQPGFAEHVRHVSHPLLEVEPDAIRARYASRLLPPVLQSIDSEVGQPRGLCMRDDRKNAALFLQFVPGQHFPLPKLKKMKPQTNIDPCSSVISFHTVACSRLSRALSQASKIVATCTDRMSASLYTTRTSFSEVTRPQGRRSTPISRARSNSFCRFCSGALSTTREGPSPKSAWCGIKGLEILSSIPRRG